MTKAAKVLTTTISYTWKKYCGSQIQQDNISRDFLHDYTRLKIATRIHLYTITAKTA